MNSNIKLHLFPAWPKDWDVDFKLHVPGNRTVQAVLRNGIMESLKIEPPLPDANVMICTPQ